MRMCTCIETCAELGYACESSNISTIEVTNELDTVIVVTR